MLTDSQRVDTDTPEGECFDPNPGRAVTEVGSLTDESFLVGRPGPGFVHFRPVFVPVGRVQTLGPLLVPVIASSKL